MCLDVSRLHLNCVSGPCNWVAVAPHQTGEYILPSPRLTRLDMERGGAGRSARRVDRRDTVGPRVVRPHLLYHQAVRPPVGLHHVEGVAPYLHVMLPPRH